MRVDVEGQWFLLHQFEGRGRNQIRFKIPVLATTRHPDISGAQAVTQFRECAQFIEVPIHDKMKCRWGSRLRPFRPAQGIPQASRSPREDGSILLLELD